ncbi:oligopeptidase B [Shigella sonnei]|uniref:Oligopeptidase B n=11 Tax=Shigella TaxID=620 RepID=A0A8H9DD69_SHIFL|nr:MULTISPECIES: oligopeptidase B [Shigella]EEZ5520446.1 oligopeptidase B [Escherichia coli]EFP8787242.1 oligopeptidase B [Shigella flexneri]EFZ3598148.1 oligopeptidase B [Shigella boydii]EIQ44472.1 protease 2 [Shigella sonnei 3226-85]EIQ45638.1 protease 2 [Shigella sonnei 3233-85]EIQ53549.1 protease II [Shigella sonnei 4822-66]EJL18481.1 protease II [Shigella sonnei str. Moseley]
MLPKAARIPHAMTLHGDTRIDNYYWLRDDTRSQPEVLDYLQQENSYGHRVMASQQALQDRILKEIIDRIPQREVSAPYIKNGYRYRHIYEPGCEYAIYQRQSAFSEEWDEWEILLDANKRAAHSEFYSMGGMAITPDNTIMALAEDFLSRRQYGIRFRNLETGNWYPELLDNVEPSFVWANDSWTFYYVRKHPVTLLPYQVWRHAIGTPASQDKLIYEEKDDTYYVSLHKTTSKHYVVIHLASATTSEVRLLDAEMADAEPFVFLPRRKDHEYSLDHYQHRFYLRSNRHGKNFGLYRTRMRDEQQWEELIPPCENIMLEGFTLFTDWLVVEERQRGLTSLRQINRKTREVIGIAFDDPAYVTWIAYNPEPETARLRYGYSSMTTPDTLFELDMDTDERRVLKQTEVPGFDAANYRSEHLWIVARDGVEVPVSLVYHRKHFRKGHNPLLVYGYGSYGASIDADFSFSRLSLLDRGFVYAIVHVRGGGELGQQWYEDGKFLKKKNTFNDYLDACDALLKLGYGSPSLCYAMGGSAGGMLMGVAINQRPELFHGVIAQVPFVDVVTTMLDESIPLTTGEFEEWGNPQDPQYYEYMKSYSPYDNVTAQAYPHLLVTTGLHDSQVQYWEPAKWVAKLRELKTDNHLLLLCTDMDSGHGGKSGRFKSYEGVAMEYAFLVALAQGTLPATPAD